MKSKKAQSREKETASFIGGIICYKRVRYSGVRIYIIHVREFFRILITFATALIGRPASFNFAGKRAVLVPAVSRSLSMRDSGFLSTVTVNKGIVSGIFTFEADVPMVLNGVKNF